MSVHDFAESILSFSAIITFGQTMCGSFKPVALPLQSHSLLIGYYKRIFGRTRCCHDNNDGRKYVCRQFSCGAIVVIFTSFCHKITH